MGGGIDLFHVAGRVGENVLSLASIVRIVVRDTNAIDVRTVNRYWSFYMKTCKSVRSCKLERSKSPAYLSEAIVPGGNYN